MMALNQAGFSSCRGTGAAAPVEFVEVQSSNQVPSLCNKAFLNTRIELIFLEFAIFPMTPEIICGDKDDARANPSQR